MTEDLPPQYELSFYLGEIVRNDTWAENEMKNLWMRLAQAGLGEGEPDRDFARVTRDVRRMLNLEPVPSEFRALALPALEATHRAHRSRVGYVHQILIQPPWALGQLRPAIGDQPAIHMTDLIKCAEELRVAMWRLRGLWIIAPHWLGYGDDEDQRWDDRQDLLSWTRVAMGHIAGDRRRVVGTEGSAPEPAGGYRELSPSGGDKESE
ncbi:hypothetical protein [Plantibacter elymi (nom. nud.)]|uniref:hypothetical protein n=1 Tax=Plantibacter elymi (nom. nud.) TaxID=199708 RepID=UPI00105554EA|nr:hypothetical protein [Plantibacter sp. VKM Ac-1784]